MDNATTPKKETQVMSNLASVNRKLGVIVEEIDRLESQLASVLRNEAISKDENQTGKDPIKQVPLAEYIHHIDELLSIQIDRLVSIQKRLEI